MALILQSLQRQRGLRTRSNRQEHRFENAANHVKQKIDLYELCDVFSGCELHD